MNKIQKQQQKIAFRCFVKNTKKVIKALKSGKTLDDLISNCETVCGHTCTDGYESEICNVKKWLQLLKEAEETDIIPCKDITQFLEYVIMEHQSRSFRFFIRKKIFEGYPFSYQDFRNLKFSISEHLKTLKNTGINIAQKKSKVYGWILLLQKANEKKIIPGGDLLDFLNFI